jgi:hypothetical protein
MNDGGRASDAAVRGVAPDARTVCTASCLVASAVLANTLRLYNP